MNSSFNEVALFYRNDSECLDTVADIQKNYPRIRFYTSDVDDAPKLDEYAQKAQAVVTIGGDGTLLKSVAEAAVHGTPIVGINFGNVGFLCEIAREDFVKKLKPYLEGEARVDERAMLEIKCDNTTRHVLNDVALMRDRIDALKISSFRVCINEQCAFEYTSDGVVVASATGSTGYTFSLGGPIVDPSSDAMLVKPLAGRMNLSGGIVVAQGEVTIEALSAPERHRVYADGVFMKSAPLIKIKTAPTKARFLRLRDHTQPWKQVNNTLKNRGLI